MSLLLQEKPRKLMVSISPPFFGYLYVVALWLAMYIKSLILKDTESQAYMLIFLGVTVILVVLFLLTDWKWWSNPSNENRYIFRWAIFDFLVFSLLIFFFFGKNFNPTFELMEWVWIALGYFFLLKGCRIGLRFLPMASPLIYSFQAASGSATCWRP
jgi:FlaA1/EpsC-like NDP-sugar epimerase